MIHQAERFVCCHIKGLLELLVNNFKIYKDFDITKKIIPELFKMIEESNKE